MPIPSTVADLNATAALNSPTGSESPTQGDDFIRAHAAIIRQVSDAASSFTQAGTGAVVRVPQDKTRESASSVTDFGAVTAVDCAAQITLASTAAREVYFPAGSWVSATTPTITGRSALRSGPGATLSGAGLAALGNTTGALYQTLEHNTTGTDFATHYVRRTANHTGGAFGFVSSGFRVDTYAGTNTSNFEWALTAVMNNSSTSATAQNVGGYLLGNKLVSSASPTWGGVIGLEETVAINNPTTQSIGLEIDCRSNGGDSNQVRVGLDVACSRHDKSGGGAATTTAFGVRVQTERDGSNSTIGVAYSIDGPSTTVGIGFDTSLATITQAAYKMAAGQLIAFDAGATKQLFYDGSGLAFADTGVVKARFNNAGSLLLNPTGSALIITGGASSGSSTPTLSANKPGANAGVTTWLSFTLNGTQLWIPAFGN